MNGISPNPNTADACVRRAWNAGVTSTLAAQRMLTVGYFSDIDEAEGFTESAYRSFERERRASQPAFWREGARDAPVAA